METFTPEQRQYIEERFSQLNGATQDRPAPGTSQGQLGRPQDADDGAQGSNSKPCFTCDARSTCAN